MNSAEAPPGDAAITEIVSRLVDALHPERIYLFGSQARGGANADSDVERKGRLLFATRAGEGSSWN